MIQNALIPANLCTVTDERPVDYADRIGWQRLYRSKPVYQKQIGQYLTPTCVADFMAGLLTPKSGVVHVLDPGAGAGVLSCACGEFLARTAPVPDTIHFYCYETDGEIIPYLTDSLNYLERWLSIRRIKAVLHVSIEDFVLKHSGVVKNNATLFDGDGGRQFDYCIINPPYFKLSKADVHAQAVLPLIHGQPNIYALFLAISARMLKDGGELAAISPRSFCSGAYFRRFRELFLENMTLSEIHLFNSRKEAFKRDRVLQENIIFKAVRKDTMNNRPGKNHRILISTSEGLDNICLTHSLKVPYSEVLDPQDPLRVIKIPTSRKEQDVLHQMKSWPGHLRAYGMEISTGPVVPFRAEALIVKEPPHRGPWAPFFWMQNVLPLKSVWPVKTRKPQYFLANPQAASLLISNGNYVLLRRFSAKEDDRRLIAAPLEGDQYQHDYFALENHLNYIHRPGGNLSKNEIWGLAALLGSSFYDSYFRMTNGNTQVSATEIRSMPLPKLELIKEFGRRVYTCGEEADIEKIMADVILRSGELIHA